VTQPQRQAIGGFRGREIGLGQNRRSATATCLMLSGCASSCRAPFTASTVVITLPRQKWCRSIGSDRTVDRIGNGSARPVLSTTRCAPGKERFVADSPLEETGFEPSVPPQKICRSARRPGGERPPNATTWFCRLEPFPGSLRSPRRCQGGRAAISTRPAPASAWTGSRTSRSSGHAVRRNAQPTSKTTETNSRRRTFSESQPQSMLGLDGELALMEA
jgi:hypothetical protein